jgi:hypothetical protein
LKKLFASAICFIALSAPAWGQDLTAAEPPQPNEAAEPAEVVEAPPIDPEEALKSQLTRLVVGNQGAILKIWKPEGAGEPDYYRGLDDRSTAPYSNEDQTALSSSLGLDQVGLEQTALTVIDLYDTLPKRNVIAFLGLVHSIGEESPLDSQDDIDAKIQQFLLNRMVEDTSVIMRRQACLALALGDTADPEVIEAVLGFFANSENLWETFPVQQFFEYHANEIGSMPNFPQIRDRVAAVNSLYTANILGYLDEARRVASAEN